MMHKGDRTKGGNMPDDLIQKSEMLMDQFVNITEALVETRKIQRGVVRSQLPCSLVLILDKTTLYVIGQYHSGALSTMYTYHPDKQISEQKVESSARWEFGFEDPFVVVFPNVLLDLQEKDQYRMLNVIATAFVESEVQRAINLMSLMQIKPLFGHASYLMDERMAVALVPPDDVGTKIFTEAIKPVMESGGVVTYRTEDFDQDEEVLKDVWRDICRARVVIADITGGDPKVMYELGIAHTVGKSALLLCKKGNCIKFPETLIKAHIIEYDDDEEGMKKLRADMAGFMKELFSRVVD